MLKSSTDNLAKGAFYLKVSRSVAIFQHVGTYETILGNMAQEWIKTLRNARPRHKKNELVCK